MERSKDIRHGEGGKIAKNDQSVLLRSKNEKISSTVLIRTGTVAGLVVKIISNHYQVCIVQRRTARLFSTK